MTKVRTTIPVDLAAEVMFSSDNTCCICRERGKALQLHHIDEDPSNNVEANLALLCLECRYRDEWLNRVDTRREKADELAISRQVEKAIPKANASFPAGNVPRDTPLSYINSLPVFRSELRKQAQVEWDSGVTSRMVIASYNYIDALQGILMALAQYYSPKQFGDKSPQEFFSEAIAAALHGTAHTQSLAAQEPAEQLSISCAPETL